MTRKLASIRTIDKIDPIPGADRIKVATVSGWKIVVGASEFQPNDQAIMLEIDSLVPSTDPRFAFLADKKYRVKTIRLKKQISQGLLLPMSKLTPEESLRLAAGEDIQTILSITLYEPPVPMAGVQKGNFPTHIVPKTDQERIQNIPEVLDGKQLGDFEITEKLDGTSCTFYIYHIADAAIAEEGKEFPEDQPVYRMGACSRNFEMQLDDDNVYAKLWHQLQMEERLKMLGRNIAIQGEIIGPSIQKNKYKLLRQSFYAFNVYDIDAQTYLPPSESRKIVDRMGLNYVPHVLFKLSEPFTLDRVLELSDGPSQIGPVDREGLVFKHNISGLSFKVISNRWLLENDE